jgi:very-short-patch-repair endonuclease
MFISYKAYLKNYAQKNRKLCTKSEGLVWNCFLKWDKTWYRFLRQKAINNYILDFYCSKLKLCIEIDGESHEWKGDYDQKRDLYLKKLWIKTVRYADALVLHSLESIGLDIECVIFEREWEINPPS